MRGKLKASNRLLHAFDIEVGQLSLNAGVEMKRAIRTASRHFRPALIEFYDEHGRLPKTVKELFGSDFMLPEFRAFIKNPMVDFGGGEVHDLPIRAFLDKTQKIVDGDHGPNWTTKVALKLLHAVYREDRSAQWKHASRILTQHGFSEEQIRLIRFNGEVRTACLKLLRPRFG
jgi:hypothetical protein